MSDLKIFLVLVKGNRWCTSIPCTTCGAREFRSGIEQIGAKQLIAQLGELDSDEFYDNYDEIRSVFKWLRYEWVVSDPSDLESIKGSPAYDYFYRQYHERRQRVEKSNENRILEEARQAVFIKARKEKASYDLPNAIARGDFKAVQGLLAKGADPDYSRGPGMNTARQTAQLWGRESWLTQANEAGQPEKPS